MGDRARIKIVSALLEGLRDFRLSRTEAQTVRELSVAQRRSRAEGGDFCGGFLRTRGSV